MPTLTLSISLQDILGNADGWTTAPSAAPSKMIERLEE
jgi:hypothetical protein